MLTQKQENFVQYIYKGLSQREAYIKAGYSSNQLPATLDRNAHTVANSSKILARLKELRAAQERDTVMTVREIEERLTTIAKEDIKSPKGTPIRSGNLQAMDILNKMRGNYTPDKQPYTDIKVVIVRENEGPKGTDQEHDTQDKAIPGIKGRVIETRLLEKPSQGEP